MNKYAFFHQIKRLGARYALLSLLFISARGVYADLSIEVTGASSQRLPIAIVNFSREEMVDNLLTPVIRADLARSGRFQVIDAGSAAIGLTSQQPDLSYLQAKGAGSVVIGSVERKKDGTALLNMRIYDLVLQKMLGGYQISTRLTRQQIRRASHQLADVIYQALTGDRGVFSTRIAYVIKQPKRFLLQVADADGYNAKTIMNSAEPILSPIWAPDGKSVAYVSLEQQKPIVYTQEIATGIRRPVAAFPGSNSSPAFAPDGKSLLVTLTLPGNSQLYRIDGTGQPNRFLVSESIDTEAKFSPNGKEVVFTSDRGGSPQIYRVSASGGNVQRVTFDGNYNVSPRFSPDGKRLVYIRQKNDRFGIVLLDLNNNQLQQLTDGPVDESPTFAPNGNIILYATKVNGRGVLATVSVDGRVQQRFSTNGDIREPAWGPFPSQADIN